jgi:hypothetical protein
MNVDAPKVGTAPLTDKVVKNEELAVRRNSQLSQDVILDLSYPFTTNK